MRLISAQMLDNNTVKSTYYDEQTQREITQVSPLRSRNSGSNSSDRFVRNVDAAAEQQLQLAERNNLYKLVELPRMFNSSNDFHGSEQPETLSVDLKSASVLDELANATENDKLSQLLELPGLFKSNNSQYR